MTFELQIDRQGRVLLPKILRNGAEIKPGTKIIIEPVGTANGQGLLITRKEKK